MTEPAWRLASAWSLHEPPFDHLRARDSAPQVPVFTIGTDEGYASDSDVRPLWSQLSPHPNLLVPVEPEDGNATCVRYAALAWARRYSDQLRSVVRWARQLVAVFSHISDRVGPEQLGRFLYPVVKIDVGHHVRVGFLPLREQHPALLELPSDTIEHWPAFDPRDLVVLVGRQLQAWNEVDDVKLRVVAHRASAPKRKRRISSLRELDDELAALDRRMVIRTPDEAVAWRWFDEGAGWLELADPARALRCFEEALKHDPDLGQAHDGVEVAHRMHREARELEAARALAAARWRSKAIPWADAEAQGLACEARRDFRGAIELYKRVLFDPDANVARCAAIARCHLQLREAGEAIDYAQRALAIDAGHRGALETLVAAMLERRWYEEALRNADRLVEIAPELARAHYLRGRALFGCGRMPEARDAFEHATKVDPRLLEAQLLRREVERVTGNVRQSVGSQDAPTFDIPEHLAELRDVLASGDADAAIDALRGPRYAHDADAQLLLARFLAFDRRLTDALEIYDRLVATSHRMTALVGKGLVLLELGRAGDALAIFEQLPRDDADAAEGEARALEVLGRLDEAAEAYRRFIALASSGSDLRVRAAELWLAKR